MSIVLRRGGVVEQQEQARDAREVLPRDLTQRPDRLDLAGKKFRIRSTPINTSSSLALSSHPIQHLHLLRVTPLTYLNKDYNSPKPETLSLEQLDNLLGDSTRFSPATSGLSDENKTLIFSSPP